jgi:hypothetical protein
VTLPADVDRVVTRYLGLVDAAAPGLVEGLYLVGSVALGDFQPRTSDVDFIAVSSAPVNEGSRQALASVHADLAAEAGPPAFDGIYVTFDELKLSPANTAGLVHHDGRLTVGPGGRSPVEWATLAWHGVPVRGPDPAELAVQADATELTAWTLENLDQYWQRWITQSKDPATRTAAAMLTDWGVAWGILGVSRQHYTVATGQITSKAGAGRYALGRFPAGWHGVIEEALRCRPEPVSAPAPGRAAGQRRRQAVAFMEAAAEDCRRLGAARPGPAERAGEGTR